MRNGSNYWARRQRQFGRRQFLGATTAASAGVAGIALVGCGDDDEPADSNSTPGATPSAESSQQEIDFDATLRVGIPADSSNYDPQAAAGIGYGSAMNRTAHFISPFATDPNTQDIVPRVASWEWVEDHTGLLVTVMPGVKFHNGETLDAEALKFNIDRFRGAGPTEGFSAGGARTLASVADVQVIDTMTVRVNGKGLDIGLPRYVGEVPLLPAQYVLDAGDARVAREPIGAGPFSFKSHVPDSELRSTRFDEYFLDRQASAAPRLPYVKELWQKVIPEDQPRLAALEANEIDVTYNLNFDSVKSLDSRSNLQVVYMNPWQPMTIQPNTFLETDPNTGRTNPWRDIRVRQAANFAVDVDGIIDSLLLGRESYSFGVPDDMFGAPKDVERLYKHDPAKAKTLLAEAGYPDGLDTILYFTSGRWPGTDAVVQAIAQQLSEVGIRASIQLDTYEEYVNGIRSKERPGLQFTGGGGLDPIRNLKGWYHSGGTVSQFSDKELDAKIEEAAAEFDDQKRRRMIAEIVTEYYEKAAWIYLYGNVAAIVMNKRVAWEPHNPSDQIPEYWNIKVLKS